MPPKIIGYLYKNTPLQSIKWVKKKKKKKIGFRKLERNDVGVKLNIRTPSLLIIKPPIIVHSYVFIVTYVSLCDNWIITSVGRDDNWVITNALTG